ncbi:MAG: hypothetical protein AAFN81_31655, partial [Bacteroidota bacterium]
MDTTKTLPILKSLRKEEWTELEAFLQSPYFNKDVTVVQLFQILKDMFQQQSGPLKINKEAVAKLLWPNRPYSAKTFTYVLTIVRGDSGSHSTEIGDCI